MGDILSPTRTKCSWKPRVEEGDLFFLPVEGGRALWLGNKSALVKQDNWRSPIFSLPCCAKAAVHESARARSQSNSSSHETSSCAWNAVEMLENDTGALKYRFVGGFNSSAVECFWDTSKEVPLWIAMKTFTGIQIKYVIGDKRPPLVFALGDEDAYAYCDLDPCQKCVANCKQGFLLYAGYANNSIVRISCGRQILW